jgi:hypothetical protein
VSSTATASGPCAPPPAWEAGSLQPDLLGDAGWWQTPLWQYAVYAVVFYGSGSGRMAGDAGGEVVRQIPARHGLELAA